VFACPEAECKEKFVRINDFVVHVKEDHLGMCTCLASVGPALYVAAALFAFRRHGARCAQVRRLRLRNASLDEKLCDQKVIRRCGRMPSLICASFLVLVRCHSPSTGPEEPGDPYHEKYRVAFHSAKDQWREVKDSLTEHLLLYSLQTDAKEKLATRFRIFAISTAANTKLLELKEIRKSLDEQMTKQQHQEELEALAEGDEGEGEAEHKD
jgi:hypothetical protein